MTFNLYLVGENYTIKKIFINLIFKIKIMGEFLGEVKMFVGTIPPRSWAFCDGSLLPISSYNALFTIMGTQFGGDGETNFALPDFRGCAPIGAGSGPGLTPRTQGESGGLEKTQLTVNEIPEHTHTAQTTASGASLGGTATATMKVNTDEAEGKVPAGQYLAPSSSSNIYVDAATAEQTLASDAITVDTSGLTVDITELNVAINPAGGSQMFSNMQPWKCINFIICIVGTFPTTN